MIAATGAPSSGRRLVGERLHFERLEERLALSSAPLSDYDRVSPAWFASIGATAATGGDSWIVRLSPAATDQAGAVAGAAQLLAHLPVTVVRGMGLPGQLLVAGRAAAAQVRAALAASPLVASFERDGEIRGSELPNDPDINNGLHPTALSQYALHNLGQFDGTFDADIDASEAWDITHGSADIITAVIDSGIAYTHPDLAANIWTNPGEIPGDGLDNDANGFVDDVRGWDFENADNNPFDDHGHGTHVAGAIGAVGHNNAGGVGVNWTTSLMPLKFLDENNVGSVAKAALAINYATMMRTRAVNPVNVRVINASWGGAGADSPTLRAAIVASGAADILFVAAAGNGDVFGRGQNMDELPFFPASYGLDNMLVVAATDRNDNLANFSNFGTGSVDVAAPGVSVWNTDLFIDGTTSAPSYGVRSGTSMAAPLVAGTAGLAWASAPNATLAEVRDAILAGGDAKANLAGKVASGKRLNALGTLVSLPPQAVVTEAPAVVFGDPTYRFTVQLTSHAGITAGSVTSGDFVVRRLGGGTDLEARLVSATPSNGGKQWTATYEIDAPGGSWDVLDGGVYEIVLVAGQLVDVNGIASRQKTVGTFDADFSEIGVFRPTVLTDGGVGSLRAAITAANAVTPEINPAGGTVILAPGIYTLPLAGAGEDANATGDLDITGNVTIASDGTGPVEIVTGDWDRVFDVRPGATFKLNGVTLRQDSTLSSYVAPVVTAGADVTIQTGINYTTKGVVADADSTTFTATVNYGEGAGAQPLVVAADKTFALSNVYEAAGTYTVTVTVSDPQGQPDVQQFEIVVQNAPAPTEISFVSSPQLTSPGGDTIASGDFTGDGIIDLISGNVAASGTLSLFRGIGDGTFLTPTTINGVSARDDLTVADLNRDGILDLVVPHGVVARSGSVQILLGLGGGTFASPVDYDTGEGDWLVVGVAVSDYDGDGHDDLAIGNFGVFNQNGSVKLLWGQGNGTFVQGPRYPTGPKVLDVVAGNVDGDPALELLVQLGTSFSVGVLDYIGPLGAGGSRQFQSLAPIVVALGSPGPGGEALYQGTLADFDKDGILDYALVNTTIVSLQVLMGNGDATFQAPTNYTLSAPQDLVAGDVNSDGWIDLAVADYNLGIRIYLNQGDGTFAAAPDLFVPAARDTVLKDFDGNGSPDVAVLREDGSGLINVFVNEGSAGNPHLTLAVPDSAMAGQSFPVVVTVRDSLGNVRTDFTGMVQFKSSVAGVALPADYTFTPGEAGSHTFWITRAATGAESLRVHLANDLSRFDQADFDVVSLASQGAEDGGGLRNAGAATLQGVEIEEFEAIKGGGVYNAGNLSISASTISGNDAVELGGGIFNAGTLEIDASTIAGNAAAQGGGVFNEDGAEADVADSTINDNQAQGPFTQLFEPRVEYDLPAGTQGVTASDIDGDMDVDLISTNYYEDSVTLLKNNGLGQFASLTITGVGNGPISTVFHPDATGDGKPDILVGNNHGQNITILAGDGLGNFSVHTQQLAAFGTNVNRMRMADFNGDGIQDVAAATSHAGAGIHLVLVQSAGAPIVKSYAVGDLTSDVRLGYLNNDTYLDAVAGNVYSENFAILLGQASGPGNFAFSVANVIPEGDDASFLELADFNADGELDLAISRATTKSVGIRLGNGDGTFQSEALHLIDIPGSSFMTGIRAGDLNRDGANDLIVGSLQNGGVYVLLGKGDGTFHDAQRFAAGANANYIELADFNGDGWLDAVVGNRDAGAVNILLNTAQYSPDGGGVYNAGTLITTNVTISGNEAANSGGGLHNSTTGSVALSNSTISNNHGDATPEPRNLAPIFTPTATLAAGAGSNTIAAGDLTGDGIGDVITGNSAANTLSLFRGNGDGTFQAPTTIPGVSTSDDLTVADLNHDGMLDLIVPHGSTTTSGKVQILLATGGGSFAAPITYDTGEGAYYAIGVVVGDYDGDGHNDIVTVNYGRWTTSETGSVTVLWNQGDGTFELGGAGSLQLRMTDVVAANIDGDPALELIAVSGTSYNLSVMDYIGSRQFQFGTPIAVRSGDPGTSNEDFFQAVTADLNGDSKADLAVVDRQSHLIHVMFGNGNGTFQTAVDYFFGPSGLDEIEAGDVNGDGWIDLVVSEGLTRIYLNQGNGTFVPQPDIAVPGGKPTALVRLDGNSSLDLAVLRVDGSNEVRVFMNRTPLEGGGGVSNSTGGVVNIRNTIVAQNTSGLPSPDVSGGFVSQGGNLIGNTGFVSSFVNGLNGNKVGNSAAPIDAKLGPLADNGGPTKTHMLAADSLAIDAAVASAPAIDQRGVVRPQDGNNNGTAEPDIGAVERFQASIRGRKFKDQNQNGVQDVGEPGLAGWTMYLDLNQNNQRDVGEPTAVTNAAGDYEFTRLDPSAYAVAEVADPGWTRTYVATVYADKVEDGVGGVTGLTNVHELAISPDGKHAYAINSDPLNPDKIVTFARNATTGTLSFVAALTNNQNDSLGTLVTGLEGEGHVVVSPNGAFVFAIGTAENAIVVFNRNATTGVLTFAQKLTTATSPNDVAVSANSQNIYVLGNSGSSLIFYQRNTVTGVWSALQSRGQTGPALVISPNGVFVYGTNGSNLFAYARSTSNGTLGANPVFTPFVAGQPAPGGGIADGLSDVTDLAIVADAATGKTFLYTLSRGDQSVGVYEQNPTTGALAFVEKITRGAADSSGTTVGGLEGGKSLAISPAGDRVYVTGDADIAEDDSIAVFRRHATSGRLFFQHALKQLADDSLLNFVTTLTDPDGVAISPDGASIYVAARDGLITSGAITHFVRDGQGLDRKTLLVGQDLAGVNFSSYAAPGEIRGIVFNDASNDGLRDGSELGFPGVVVYLDADNDNEYDAGEATVTTDALGQYKFTDLTAPASYAVRLKLLPVGQTVTSPSASAFHEHVIPLAPSQVYVGADFLVHAEITGEDPFHSVIAGQLWRDANGDGVKQVGEEELVGRQVYLDVNDNGVHESSIDLVTTTGVEGRYSFTNLGPANFVVRVVPLPGELTTTPIGNAFTRQSLITGANPLGVAAADFDLDGRIDLATVDGSVDRISVRLQQPGGTFGGRSEYAVGSQPTGLAVGRFNNDLYPDIAVVHWGLSKVVFLINDGDGTFTRAAAVTDVPVSIGYASIAAADIDLDGDDDLAVTVDGAADAVHILRNNNGAAPAFTQVQQHSLGTAGPLSIVAGDLTGDGRAEFLLGHFDADKVQVLRNDAGGATFALLAAVPVADGPSAVTIAPDLNGDGFKDAVVANIGVGAVTILAGNGAGGLAVSSPLPAGQGPRSVAAADVDQDGDLDLVVGNAASNDVVVLRRIGIGLAFSFPESTGLASFSQLATSGVKQVLALDLDGDGDRDVVAVRGNASTGSLAILDNVPAPGSIRLTLDGINAAPGQNFGIRAPGPAHPGDYDGSLVVTGHDFLAWQRALGTTAVPPGSGADGNSDGSINGSDLTVWRDNYEGDAAVAAQAEAVIASLETWSDALASAHASIGAAQAAVSRDAIFAGGDFTQLFAEARAFRPQRRGRLVRGAR